MATFLEEIGRAVRQTACAVISVNDAVNGFMEGIGTPGASEYADRTRALRRQLCDNNDPVVPAPTPPFTGGQCDTIYAVTYRVKNGQSPWAQQTTNFPGPIQGLEFRSEPAPNDRVRKQWLIKHAGGEDSLILVPSAFPDQVVLAEILNVARIDGQPDDCGDVPTPIPPYVPTTTTVNISYENNQQITINEDVDVTVFAPQVNLIGGIFAPITISGNNFSLIGNAEFTPEFKLNLSPRINIGAPGNTDNPVPNPSEPIPEPEEEDPTRMIVGVIVTTTDLDLSRIGQISQDGNPDIFIPRLGSVSFYITTPNGNAWTTDVDIKNLRCYIPCPVPSGATDVAATPQNGIHFSVQPVWGYPGQQLPG